MIGSTSNSGNSTSPITAGAGAAPGSATTDTAAMQDRFLKLLVAQINNQDPRARWTTRK